MSPEADLILENGRVFLGIDSGCAGALAVFGNRVLATGNGTALKELKGSRTRVINLDGRAAIPGINDGHQHPLSLGMTMSEVDLKPETVSTLDALLAAVKAQVDKSAPGEWVFGGRYDHFHLDIGRHPYREEIDRVAPDNPVFIKRTCGHMGVANSAALEAAGINDNTSNPAGGNVEKQNGRLSGLLQERAQELITNILPPRSLDTLMKGIEDAGALLCCQGITSVMDAAVGNHQGFEHYLAYQEARRRRRLPLRTYLSFCGGPGGIQQSAYDTGLITGAGDEYLKVGSVKLFADGSAGGKTAAMQNPYQDSCEELGILLFKDEELNDFVLQYHRQGYQISIHAIGDAAIEQAINAFELAAKESPTFRRRHRIEHCGFTNAQHIDQMHRLGLIPAPQPIFLYDFGDLYMDVLGEERSSGAYPMKTWMTKHMHPVASTDAPVCDSNPMKNLYSMLSRKTSTGRILGAGEALTMEEAISAMTYNGAYGSFSETAKGTLDTGMLADIAVFDRDIFAVSPEELLETQVDLTILDGKIVFERNS
ncbi:MAG: amidohydrolase [Gammaproteobacteria bacterium]|nr:amidohydrolase [Gammaproteobacteria bacterium]